MREWCLGSKVAAQRPTQTGGEKQPSSRQEKAAMFDGPAAQSQRGGDAVQLREKDSRLKQRQYCSES